MKKFNEKIHQYFNLISWLICYKLYEHFFPVVNELIESIFIAHVSVIQPSSCILLNQC